MVDEIEACTDYNCLSPAAAGPGAFQEDAAKFCVVQQKVVRPFQCQAIGNIGPGGGDALNKRQSGHESELHACLQ